MTKKHLLTLIVLIILQACNNKNEETGYIKKLPDNFIELKFKDQENRDFSLSLLNEKIYVVDFFFSRCRTMCPRLSSNMQIIHDHFIENEKVKLLSISVDPGYDSTSILYNYANIYNAKKNKWFFITGDKDNIYKLADENGFDVADAGSNPDNFVHTEKFTLVNTEHKIVRYYNGLDKKEIEFLISDLELLLD